MSSELNVFPPNSKPFGRTFPEWIVSWWRWLLSIPKQNNPAIDLTGIDSGENQWGSNVWFLAGTFGGSVQRTCKIPRGKAIFMPVINYECSLADSPTLTTEAELESKCTSEIDDIRGLTFQLDNLSIVDLSPFRYRSPIFTVDLIEDNVLGAAPGPTKMATDGFWAFLKPPKIGEHVLITFGSCRSGRIRIGTTYHLNVE
jgi:hypothetical protein